MADIIDIANDQYERHLEEYFRNRNAQAKKPSRKFCEDCETEIPEQRRALGGVTKCVDCQDYWERKRV